MGKLATGEGHSRALLYMLLAFLASYGLLILAYADFSPTDDVAFLGTVMQGLPVLSWGPAAMSIGRFAPVGAQEFNLIVLLNLPQSPYTMFVINAVQFAVAMGLLLAVLRSVTHRTGLIAAIMIVFLFLPGSTISWFRVSVGERDMVFYLAIFVFSYLRFLEGGKLGFMLAALVAGNAVIYCKEPMFLAIAVFAGTHLLATWKASTSRQRALDAMLLASAVIFIVLYYFLVHLHRGPHLYSDTNFNAMLVFAKNMANYAVFSDPVVVLLLWPLTAWRLYRLIRGWWADYCIHDSLLLAGSAYGAAYLLLNMYQPYYFLPVYVFAIPALTYYLVRGQFSNPKWKWAAGAVAVVLALNTLPAGVHYLSRNKYLAMNYNDSVDFLVQDIRSRYPSQKARIFLDGVDRGEGLAGYYILGEFLKYKGLPRSAFDLASNVEAACRECPKAVTWDKSDAYTVYESGDLPVIQSGDYLVITADANMQVDDAYLRELERKYQLLFHTKSDFSVPLITAKTALKYLLLVSSPNVDREWIVGRNLLNTPDYFVFIRR